jgi:hypothetical protein
MSEAIDNIKNNVVAALKSEFEGLVRETLADAKGDIKAYGQQLAQEYGKYLWRSLREGDDVAREALKDLKAQVLHLAVRREIIVMHETTERLKDMVSVAARVGLKALLAAAVAL